MSNRWSLLVNKMTKPEVSEYGSVDPAPAEDSSRINVLRTTLLDENEMMFKRMRAVFALRNIRSQQAIDALCDGFSSKSALLKHELAYVLGQIQDKHALNNSIKEVLEKHLQDPLIEISESCEVALDLLAYYNDR